MNDQADSNQAQSTLQGVVAGSIPLFAGHPSHDLLPILDIQQTIESAFGQADVWRMFDYGDEQGDPDLITFLVERFNRQENLDITSDNLMIVAGSTGGVTMITNLLTQPNDTILVDAPSYRDALHIFRDNQLDMHSIPIDEGGIIVAEMVKSLESLKAENRLPKFYYVVPNFQNPTGITLSQARREAIIELSQQYDFVIVEDDVYSDIRFVDDIPPSFFALADGKNALRLGTFSKTLSPGLRLGWLLGDADQIQRFVTSGKLRMGGGANPFTAKIVADYCKSGAWDKHIQWLRGQYQTRRDIALTALSESMPASVTWTQPQGGYFIWVTLPEAIHVDDFEKIANQNSVYFSSGMGFFVNPNDGKRHIRLSFSFVPHDDIKRGIEVLGRLINELS
jgi:2-aminoadipate transaminase